ncbi:unnamed protein product [Phytomonas sp. Hart1]|nr:unnamed protein product [Phytomonas sp. Hart1]|eukprot:CCW71488.1 unnamed protein product [Phytomonas sp. isolate Hart1]
MAVCGTQAEAAAANQLVLLHVGNLGRTKHDQPSDADSEVSFIGDPGESEEGSQKGDDAEDDVEELNNGEPTVYHRGIPHHGVVNRLRCDPAATVGGGSSSALVAVWSDTGRVQVFDLDSDRRALTDFANWSKERARRAGPASLRFSTPSSTHQVEGFGLGWSAVRAHVFASGDVAGALYVWHPTEDGRWQNVASNMTGMNSIEEVQWSPTQAEVLITARAGGDVEVWDVRDLRGSQLHWQADPTDINVADWNPARQASHLLVTGADSGAVAIWDLRRLTPADPIQRLSWHKKSITSVEFSHHNESVLAVTSDDGQCTLWDLSLERDLSEEQGAIGDCFGRKDLTDIPDQLMFQHQGLIHPKEVHWHSQIPGMVITTDYEGLHLFKPMNWRSLMK